METFTVSAVFVDGSHLCEGRGLDARDAVALAYDCARRPAARLGIIERVIIVDDGDRTVFEWRYRRGVIFPPRCPVEAGRDREGRGDNLIVLCPRW